MADNYQHMIGKVFSKCSRALKLRQSAQQLRKDLGATVDADACCNALWTSDFRPIQKGLEARRLFEIVKAHQPKTICEIGAAGGGTAFIFTQAAPANSLLISVDIGFDYPRRLAIRQFARAHQTVLCLRRDSHDKKTLRKTVSLLKGRALDVLFIDGDHTYEGVSTDFRLYCHLVRKGGLIIFHDIVPDFRVKHGTDTYAFTGGVPQFWSELKSRYSYEELIENPNQDGYGIGLLNWPGELIT